MGAADKAEHGKEKENENDKEEDEEAQAVKRWSEAPVGGGFRGGNFSCSAHASELDYEDYSEDQDPDDYELLDSDQDESEDVNSGERDSREHGLQAPGALLAVPVASSSSHGLQQLLSPSSDMPSSVSTPPRIVCSSLPSAVAVTDSNGRPDGEQRGIRLSLPSKGRLHGDTLGLLKDCGLSVQRDNPRQYLARIPRLSNLQVWLQRPKDIVKKLLSGDLDIGIVGFDTFSEHGQGNEDLIIVHEALGYGDCHLSLAIPTYGIFEKINSVKELAQMPQWTEEKPLRVATGFGYLGPKFMKENGLKHVSFSTGEGALEAAPAMGTADVILDLVSSGTTLKENNLKEIEGGTMLESQAVLVASRKSLIQREGVPGATHEILERLEAHLKAVGQFTVTGYMSGSSLDEVAERVFSQLTLSGLEEPAIREVFHRRDGKMVADGYAIDICGPEELLDSSVQQLRAMEGCRVQVSQITKIYNKVNSKWQELQSKLGEEHLSKFRL